MTTAVQTFPSNSDPATSAPAEGTSASARESWENLRDDGDIQFEPVEIPPIEPRELSAFEEALRDFFKWLGEVFAPIGQALGGSWVWLQWVILGLLAALILYLLIRTFGPLVYNRKNAVAAEEVPEWQPDQAESLALLEDADRLAAAGQYDEATHLLLMRSVNQIATARPDWVEPSSTARELAALPALSEAARSAFGTISERVERSLFALRSLDRADWETARAAYAEFALTKLDRKPLAGAR
ncbi:MAG: hypothetical protein AAF494_12135 [Pseudomonadota bacterium]